MRPDFLIRPFNLIRLLALGWMSGMAAFGSANAQTASMTLPEQLMRSQPATDLLAPATCTASFDPPQIGPGEKSIYRITFNAPEISIRRPASIPAPTPLHLHWRASGQNLQIIGNVAQTFSTFNYEAVPTMPGSFTLPEFNVEVYGKPVTVPAATLVVKSQRTEPAELARQLVVEPAANRVFVGEPLNVSVRLQATPAHGVEGVSQLQLNGDGFVTDKSAARQSIQTLKKNGVPLPAFVYETRITPITAGTIKLSAQGYTAGMQFSGPVVISGQVSLSSGPPQYLLLDSEPVTIEVLPLPTGNELPGFNGAIGHFSCDPPLLATNRLAVGDPVQLTVIFRGSPNLDRLHPPLPPRTPEWQIFPATPGGSVAAAGTNPPGAFFHYTLIPLSYAPRATPAIPFSCFDPALGCYLDLTIPPVPVTLPAANAGSDVDTAQLLAEDVPGSSQSPGWSRLAATPGPRSALLGPLQFHPWFWFVQGLPVLGFIGLGMWERRRRRWEQHPEWRRRREARRALRRARRVLERAADDADFLRGAVSALQIACAPHYPATPWALVCGDILQLLPAAEREGEPGETVRRIFAAADTAAFAANKGTRSNILAEKVRLKKILANLEERL